MVMRDKKGVCGDSDTSCLRKDARRPMRTTNRVGKTEAENSVGWESLNRRIE